MAERFSGKETLYSDALRALRHVGYSRGKPSIEECAPADAIGRIAASEVLSPVAIPRYSNSAVDGFALRSCDVDRISAPTRIRVLGSIVAGDMPPRSSAAELTAWEIMTGAPFPEGFDCSVKIEDVEVIRNSKSRAEEIILTRSLAPEENLRGAGEDFLQGDVVLHSGERIGPEQLLALATLGISKVAVFRKPLVAIISTGGELCASGMPLGEGQIHNSTAPYLLAALREMGAEARFFGTAGDDPAEFFATLKTALESRPDVILSTGAVSMGVHDYVSSVVSDLGGKTLFHRASIRPGKPILAAEFPEALFFGLPGNPVSTVVGLRFFVDPYLRAWMRQPAEKPSWVKLKARVRKPDGLRCFFKARVTLEKNETNVTILPGQPSFMISPLLRSTAWGVLSEAGEEFAAGDWVEVYPFYSSSYAWSSGAWPETTSATHSQGECCQ